MSRDNTSSDSLAEATRSRASFSGHGNAKGAAGFRVEGDGGPGTFLTKSGETAIVNPQKHGFDDIKIGAAWDNIDVQKPGFINKLLGRTAPANVDLDLGCLYELQDGRRGAIQAFGQMFGSFDEPPYLELSGDERTGDAEGDDEFMMVNGKNWPEIKRILVYVYIYGGAPNWAVIKPQIHVDVPGEKPLVIVPAVDKSDLAICAVAGLENVRNGIRLTNYNEYYHGHPAMDRAFGFGLQWDDGVKI